jgi:hypothetical protein
MLYSFVVSRLYVSIDQALEILLHGTLRNLNQMKFAFVTLHSTFNLRAMYYNLVAWHRTQGSHREHC